MLFTQLNTFYQQECSHTAESSSERPWIKLNSPAGLSAGMSDRDAEVCVLP